MSNFIEKIPVNKLLTLIILVPLLNGCKKKEKNYCVSFTTAPVISIEGPSAGNVNQDIQFTITFPIVNGCGSFSKFEEPVTGNTTIIKVIAKYEGCMCTEIYGEEKRDYIFRKTLPGNYQLKFSKGDNNYLIKEITIQ